MSQEGRQLIGEGMKYVSLSPAFDRQPLKAKKQKKQEDLRRTLKGFKKLQHEIINTGMCLPVVVYVCPCQPSKYQRRLFFFFSFFGGGKEIRGRPFWTFFYSFLFFSPLIFRNS